MPSDTHKYIIPANQLIYRNGFIQCVIAILSSILGNLVGQLICSLFLWQLLYITSVKYNLDVSQRCHAYFLTYEKVSPSWKYRSCDTDVFNRLEPTWLWKRGFWNVACRYIRVCMGVCHGGTWNVGRILFMSLSATGRCLMNLNILALKVGALQMGPKT
jgi:hypothetical protein